MKKKWIAILCVVCSLATGTAVYAAGQLSLKINGVAVKDSGAYLRDDRVYVPLRIVSEQLGGEVAWNSAKKEVSITGGGSGAVDIWKDDSFPGYIQYNSVINVVNRYMAALQGAFSSSYDADEDFKLVLSAQAIQDDVRVWHPFSGMVGSSMRSISSYKIIDGRTVGKDAANRPIYEVAVRYNVINPGDDSTYKQVTKAYTVITEVINNQLFYKIDQERLLSTVKLNQEPSPFK
ncbi:copper amine oxidase N-terminal domain-containing protein [Paenibacillus lignilyticus]|uniref:Copper amine oxidase-like N-terminal domain-containing protein n=1 Tax=Paenibacillus lignilyticus TaxID=1172615 RepID=A0ABS5CCM3_9BACL|nr:copper amine oxidase N-terminal domain-containing protein [Paenibacillus lignilyticus]MBP3961652.1 hypothetical protein [Paenibacillus lignilyticus]MBP3963678.1 hypothetical protein [Paenibacillus lignilyticus]